MSDIEHLVLEDSYVLGIAIEPYRIEFAMDFVLAPRHPKYIAPGLGDKCYRRGMIRVLGFRTLIWHASNLKPSTDASGEQDYGCLDEMALDGESATFRGDWGEIVVTDGTLAVILSE